MQHSIQWSKDSSTYPWTKLIIIPKSTQSNTFPRKRLWPPTNWISSQNAKRRKLQTNKKETHKDKKCITLITLSNNPYLEPVSFGKAIDAGKSLFSHLIPYTDSLKRPILTSSRLPWAQCSNPRVILSVFLFLSFYESYYVSILVY